MAKRNVDEILADPSFWESDDDAESDFLQRDSDEEVFFESDLSDSASDSDSSLIEENIDSDVNNPFPDVLTQNLDEEVQYNINEDDELVRPTVNTGEWTYDLIEPPDIKFSFEDRVGVDQGVIGDVNSFEAVDFFELFFTDYILRDIVLETNRYAFQSNQNKDIHKDWTNISVPELKTWIGLIVATGLVQKKGRLAAYWSKHWLLQTPGFNQTITSKRFLQILSSIHFADNESTTIDKADKLWKVRKPLDYIVKRFQDVYNPEREIAVDETMLKFKGRLGIKQYIKNKPIKWGLKLFTLAESSTGYVLNIIPYAGKRDETSMSKSAQIVIDVCHPYLQRGHRLFMDNYYTSMELIEKLAEMKTLSCGTVNSNRKGLPKDIKNSSPAIKNLKRGESLKRQCNNVLAVSWRDTRVVNLLTNIPGNLDDIEINRYEKKNKNQVIVTKPQAIVTYNTFMGGVDLSDQRVASYRRHMKSLTWYLQIFFYLLRLSAVQAFLLYRKTHRDSKLSQYDFFVKLSEGLIGGRSFTKKKGRPSVELPPEIRFDRKLNHAPVKLSTQSKCIVHSNRVDTTYGCGICNKRMCPYPCFYRYHYCSNYAYNDPEKENAAPARKRKKQN